MSESTQTRVIMVVAGIWWAEARDAAQRAPVQGTVPRGKGGANPKVHGTGVEKLVFRCTGCGLQQSRFLCWGVGCPDSLLRSRGSGAWGAAWSPRPDMGLNFGTSLTSRVTLGKSLNLLPL